MTYSPHPEFSKLYKIYTADPTAWESIWPFG